MTAPPSDSVSTVSVADAKQLAVPTAETITNPNGVAVHSQLVTDSQGGIGSIAGSAAEEQPAHTPDNDSSGIYGLSVQPEFAFEAARTAVRRLHGCLDALRAGKAAPEAGTDGGGTFAATARTMQLQLLALRRAHRSMVQATDRGRAIETDARRSADAEHAHLETRMYEATCCRAAARRCRAFPTPQLSKLGPLLDGAEGEEGEEGDEEDADGEHSGQNGEGGSRPRKGLALRLETEKNRRADLCRELEGLELEKSKDLENFRGVAKISDELSARLCAVEQALEPVCDLIEYRPRPTSLGQPLSHENLAELSPALQLVFAKFDVLAAFGPRMGVTVSIDAATEDGKPPPEKRARVDGAQSSLSAVCVAISSDSSGTSDDVTTLRFGQPHPSLVTVSLEGDSSHALLEGLWPGDDGRHSGFTALLPAGMPGPGRPYGWAQILAGLRASLLVTAPALQTAEGVTAADVVQRVRAGSAETLQG